MLTWDMLFSLFFLMAYNISEWIFKHSSKGSFYSSRFNTREICWLKVCLKRYWVEFFGGVITCVLFSCSLLCFRLWWLEWEVVPSNIVRFWGIFCKNALMKLFSDCTKVKHYCSVVFVLKCIIPVENYLVNPRSFPLFIFMQSVSNCEFRLHHRF